MFNRGTAEVVTTSEPPSGDPTDLVTLAERAEQRERDRLLETAATRSRLAT